MADEVRQSMRRRQLAMGSVDKEIRKDRTREIVSDEAKETPAMTPTSEARRRRPARNENKTSTASKFSEDSARQTAAQSPWYVLATLCGEQTGELFDEELHARNRSSWNRWISSVLSDATKKSLIENHHVERRDLNPLNNKEREELRNLAMPRLEPLGLTLPLMGDQRSPSKVEMQKIEFSNRFSADGFVFPGNVNFNGSIFCNCVSFERAVFLEYLDARDVQFEHSVVFRDAIFLSSVDFKDASFKGSGASFFGVEFGGFSNFDGANFCDRGSYRNATFQRQANFISATFQHAADFIGAEFQDYARFKEARFLGRTWFGRVKFKSSVEFDSVQFRYPPDFRDTELPFSTTWRAAHWPGSPSDPETADDAVEHYAALRHAMKRAERHDAELDFFVREIQAKRILVGNLHRVAITVYLALSDGGRSLGRPATAWLIGNAVSVVLHAPLSSGYIDLPKRFTVELFALIVGNALVLGSSSVDRRKLDRLHDQFGYDMPALLQIFDLIHTGFSALCLFLMALAVRNWLRLR